MKIMDSAEAAMIKHREIAFAELHPDRQQAHTAAAALADAPGVVRTEPLSPVLLGISYDLVHVTFEQIEAALTEAGYHLSSRLLY